MNNNIAIIPARMASSRFPGKPMAKICGVPMIGHVYHRCKMNSNLNGVYVATCDQEIYDYIESIGGKAVMTADTHERCTDRTMEALLKIEQQEGKKADIVVMVQGDEPMMAPEMIDLALSPFNTDPTVKVVNLMSELKTKEEHADPNEVKVVVDLNNDALYFSREPIPSWKKGAKSVPMMKQVCLIPFKRDFLVHYSDLKPTPLEEIESVDMMRILEHGEKVRMVFSDHVTYAVDTPEDLQNVERHMANDEIMKAYS